MIGYSPNLFEPSGHLVRLGRQTAARVPLLPSCCSMLLIAEIVGHFRMLSGLERLLDRVRQQPTGIS